MKTLVLTLMLFSKLANAQTMHLFTTVDNAKDIGQAVKIDQRNFQALFSEIGSHLDAVQSYTVPSESLSFEKISKTIKSMKVAEDDVLVFYYSGHGNKSSYQGSPWPRLTPNNGQSIEVRDVLNELNAHMSRQVIVVIDACNGEFHEGPTGQRWPASSINPKTIKKLFKDFRGNVVTTSSKPGLVSYTLKDDFGSLFTYAFKQILQNELSQNDANWEKILSKTKQLVVSVDQVKVQTPRFKVTKQ